MNELEVFQTLQRIENKLDTGFKDINTCVNDKISSKLFYWVLGFVIAALIGLGGAVGRVNVNVVSIEKELKGHITYTINKSEGEVNN